MNDIDQRRGATSASNAQADSLCPGRHLAQKNLPTTESPDATFGREIHEALSKGTPDGLTLEQQGIYDGCQQLALRLLSQVFGDDWEKARLWNEKRLWAIVPGGFEHSGQPDRVYRHGQKALILEFKTLTGDVPESSRNLQLRDQAVLVAGNLLVGEVAVAVVQPLVTWEPELCLYTADDLKRAETDLFARVRASNDPASPRVPGGVQCKWCRAKTVCKEYGQWASSMLPVKKTLVDVPMAEWTPEDCAGFLSLLHVCQGWLDEGQTHCKERLISNPDAIPGFTLKPGAKVERITDPQAVFDRFTQSGGTLAQFMATITVGKGKLKEQLAVATSTKGKALDGLLSKLVEGLVEMKQNAPSIVKKDA